MKEKILTIGQKITFPLILFSLLISTLLIFLMLFNVIDSGVGMYSLLGLALPVPFIFIILYAITD